MFASVDEGKRTMLELELDIVGITEVGSTELLPIIYAVTSSKLETILVAPS